MRGQAKPGADWTTIRAEYEEGISLRELARRHGLTHKAVQKRRDKEGWSVEARLRAGARAVVATNPATGAATPARTSTAAERILESFRKGLPKYTAAAMAGMDRGTLDSWLESDPAFSALAQEAQEAWHASKLANIDAAGDRGDWKADAYRLERHSMTREAYAQKNTGGVNLQVNLNIDRAQPEPIVTVEHKA